MASIQEQYKLRLDAAIDTGATAKSLADIKKSIKELKGLAAEIGPEGGAAFEEATRAAAEFQDRIDDVNDSIKAIKGDSIEQLGGSFSLLKDGLFSLDFDKASQGATKFADTIRGFNTKEIGDKFNAFKKQIGDVGSAISEKFGSKAQKDVNALGGAVQSTGKSFQGLNTILKLSLIGVIVGAVILLITKFDELKESGGRVGRIFQALSAPLEYLINGFNKLINLLSITNKLGQEATDNAIKRNEKLSEAIAKRYDRERALAEATGKDIFALESKQLQDQQEITAKNIAMLEALKEKDGGLNAERQKNLDEYKVKYEDFVNAIAVLDAKRNSEGVKAGEDSLKRTNKLNLDLIKSEKDRSIAKIKLDAEERKSDLQKTKDKIRNNLEVFYREIEVEKSRVNLFGGLDEAVKSARIAELNGYIKDQVTAYQQISAEQIAIDQNTNNQIANINDTAATGANNKAKKKAEDHAKELKSISDKYLLDEREKIAKGYDDDLAKLNQKNAKEKALYDELLAKKANALALFDQAQAQKEKEAAEESLKTVKNNNDKELELYEKFGLSRLEIDKEYERLRKENAIATDEEIYAQIEKNAQKKKDTEERTLKSNQETNEVALDAQQKALEGFGVLQVGAKTKAIREIQRLNNEASESEKAEAKKNLKANIINEIEYKNVVDRTNNEIKENNKAAQQEILKVRLEAIDAALQASSQFVGALQSLGDTITNNQLKGVKKGSAEEKKIQKKAFNRNKTFGIVQAGINGALAITNILANTVDPTGVYKAILIAGAAATTLAQIAAIKSKQFNADDSGGGGEASGAAAGSALGGSASASSISAPSLFNLGNGSNISPSDQRVYLVESDVTDMQRKVEAIQSTTYLTRKR